MGVSPHRHSLSPELSEIIARALKPGGWKLEAACGARCKFCDPDFSSVIPKNQNV